MCASTKFRDIHKVGLPNNKSKAAKSDSVKLSDNEHVMNMLRCRLNNPVALVVNAANKDSYHGHLVKITETRREEKIKATKRRHRKKKTTSNHSRQLNV